MWDKDPNLRALGDTHQHPTELTASGTSTAVGNLCLRDAGLTRPLSEIRRLSQRGRGPHGAAGPGTWAHLLASSGGPCPALNHETRAVRCRHLRDPHPSAGQSRPASPGPVMDDPLSEPQAAPQVAGGRRRPGASGKTPPFPGRLWGSHRAQGTAHTGNAGGEGVLPYPPHTRHQPGPSRLQDTVEAPKQTHQQRPGVCGPRCWPQNVPCVVPGHRPDRCPGKHPPRPPFGSSEPCPGCPRSWTHLPSPAKPTPVSTQQPCQAPHSGSLRPPPGHWGGRCGQGLSFIFILPRGRGQNAGPRSPPSSLTLLCDTQGDPGGVHSEGRAPRPRPTRGRGKNNGEQRWQPRSPCPPAAVPRRDRQQGLPEASGAFPLGRPPPGVPKPRSLVPPPGGHESGPVWTALRSGLRKRRRRLRARPRGSGETPAPRSRESAGPSRSRQAWDVRVMSACSRQSPGHRGPPPRPAPRFVSAVSAAA